MGSKKMGLLLICFTCFYLFASSYPLQRALLSAGTHEYHINGIDDVDSNERGGIAHGSKYALGSKYGGARGGGASGAGSAETANGNGGGGGDVQGGGSAVIPVIVAGAANNNHHPNNHHNGAGSCQVNCILLPTLILTTLAFLIVQLFQVFGLLV